MASPLAPVECSAQPLSFSFHPVRDIVAAGLVDGTVEVHDLVVKRRGAPSPSAGATSGEAQDDDGGGAGSGDDDEDAPDTILSSIRVAKGALSPDLGARVPTATESTSASAMPVGYAEDAAARPVTPKAAQGPSCRRVLFSRALHEPHDGTENDGRGDARRPQSGGEHLFTACSGGSLRCLDSERACSLDHFRDPTAASPVLWSVETAHNVGVSALYQLPPTSPCGPAVVSGDDAGTVRLWDARTCGGQTKGGESNPFDNLMTLPAGCIQHWKVNHDYVTDFTANDDGSTLFASSADGTLAVFDVRFPRRAGTPRAVTAPAVAAQRPPSQSKSWEASGYARSDHQDDELLSLALLKNSQKLLCGTQQGVLLLFSYGAWGDISDRFPGHPQSLDALLKIDEDTVLTGSSDGLVRAVQLLPNALLGVLGGHDGFPVEGLGFSAGRRMVGSLSHDEFIRLWDGSFLKEDSDNDDDAGVEEDKMQEDAPSAKPGSRGVSTTKAGGDSEDEWDDIEEDEDEDMESDENGSDSKAGGGKPKKRTNIFKTENEAFFSDL